MLSLSLFMYYAMVVVADENTVPSVSSLSPTPTLTKAPIAASPVPIRPCYSNLTEIEALVSLKSPFTIETYILCPNTVYVMASFDPPILIQANSIFQCGADGKSSNNCVITGGGIQILHQDFAEQSTATGDVLIKGITFEDAAVSSIIMVTSGSISVIDCIFRNHRSNQVIQLLYCESCFKSRKLMNTMDYDHMHGHLVKYYSALLSETNALATMQKDASGSRTRFLQDVTSKSLNVNVDGCLFENITRGNDSNSADNSLIYLSSASNQVTIKNSIFRDNDFVNQNSGVQGDGYAIGSVDGAKVSIIDTCFSDNRFAGKGVVFFEGPAEEFNSSNVFGTIDDKLMCSFASINGESCIGYDSLTCTALGAFTLKPSTTNEDSTFTAGGTGDGFNASRSCSINTVISFLVIIAAFFGAL